MGPQVYFFVFYPEFVSYIISMKIDCLCGKIKQFGNLFCGFSVFYEIGYLNFLRGHGRELIGQSFFRRDTH